MSSTPTKAPPGASGQSGKELLQSAEFKHLVNRRWKVSFILLALLFVSYYGYILLVASSKEWVSQKVSSAPDAVTTIAIPLGVAAIVFAWALTAFYVVWANRSYDPEVERLKGKLKR
jgi:uncharacterized membrane protein (DUF485 family)